MNRNVTASRNNSMIDFVDVRIDAVRLVAILMLDF